MKRLIVFGLVLLTAGVTFGQRRGGGGGGGYGQGNILNPGGVSPGGSFGQGNILNPSGVRPGPMVPPPGLGNMVSNYPSGRPGTGMGRPPGDGYGRGRTVVVPYAVPVYYGPSYGYGSFDGYYSSNQPSTNVTVVMPQQPTPQVIINQNFVPDVARPVLKDYSDADLPEPSSSLRIYEAPTPGRTEEPKPARKAESRSSEPRVVKSADDKPTIYLIALRDASVRAALGYWSEDGTLNYVTPQGSVNHVSLDMLDRATTDQLNRERGLEFELKGR